jgi:HSP20 family protein
MAIAVHRHNAPPQQLRRWNPFSELEELHERMEQLMEPFVDIEETDDAWILEVEIPGVKRDDVKVEMNDNELVISGEIKERERTGILRRRTRRRGSFEFRVMIPGDVDPDAIEANLGDGVLTVRIPKAEKAHPRRIEVQTA